MGGAVGVASEEWRREEENGSSSSENSPFDWVLGEADSAAVDLQAHNVVHPQHHVCNFTMW